MAERVPLTPHPNDHNLAYLLTKRDRMGHVLPDLAALGPAEVHQSTPRSSAEGALRAVGADFRGDPGEAS